LLLTAAPLCAAAVDRRAVVNEMIERSRLLEDAYFTVPNELYRRYVLETSAAATAVPPVAIIPEQGVYHLHVSDKRKITLSVRFDVVVLDPAKAPAIGVLAEKIAWRKVKIDGKDARLPVVKGLLTFTPQEPGRHVLTAEAPLGKLGLDGRELRLAIPRTVRTLVRFDSPAAWEVSAADGSVRIVGRAPEGTHGLFALRPCGELAVRIAAPRPHRRRPPRYRISGQVAWNIDAGSQQVAARLKIVILGGPSRRIDLSLPAGAERIRVTGPDVRDVQTSAGSATAFLRGSIADLTRLDVRYELPAGRGPRRRLDRIRIRDGQWSGGMLVVTSTAGNREVLPETISGLRELTTGDIPKSAKAILAGSVVLAYEITSRQWSAGVELVDLGKFALRESIADLAHFRVLLSADGTMLCKAGYEIRNRAMQYVRLDLPRGAKVLGARVNDKPRPLSPVAGSEDTWLLPLVRSKASVMGLVSFPVEIVFICRTDPIEGRDAAEVPLPRIDLPIAYAWCELYAPKGMDVRRWSGPMRNVEQYSSETAIAHLGYGRSELAEGYKTEKRDLPTIARMPATPTQRPAASTPAPGPKAAPAMKPKRQPRPKAKPEPTIQRDSKALDRTDSGWTYDLGKNYFRAGRDFYEQGELDKARESLAKALKLAPKSPEAVNAKRLLSNIDLARGRRMLSTSGEKAAGLEVKRELAEANVSLLRSQRRYAEAGQAAAAEGRFKDAITQLDAAEAVTERLLRQGADLEKVKGNIKALRSQMSEVTARKQAEVRRIRKRVEHLKIQGDYSGALDEVGKLRRLTRGREKQMVQAEMEELSVRAVKKELTTGYKAPAEQPKQAQGAAEMIPTRRSRLAGAAEPEAAVKTVTRVYDVGDLTIDDDRLGDDERPRRVKDEVRAADREIRTNAIASLIRETVKPDSWRGRGGGGGIHVTSGRLVVTQTGKGQKAVANLLDRLRDARGPQVEEGEKIAEQRARGLALRNAPRDEDSRQLRRFIDENYKWAMTNGRELRPRTQPTGGVAPKKGKGVPVSEIADKLRYNLGQKIYVNSLNLNTDAAAAGRLGIRFRKGANDVRYAVIDEAQFRTLNSLAADNPILKSIAAAQRGQETIVGTDALLANEMVANASYAGDRDNTIDIADNPIRLPHEKYILIDNDDYLTAVRAGAMQHWQEKTRYVQFAEAPQSIDVPPVGRLAKFEKTLVKPTDRLVLKVEYDWKGVAR